MRSIVQQFQIWTFGRMLEHAKYRCNVTDFSFWVKNSNQIELGLIQGDIRLGVSKLLVCRKELIAFVLQTGCKGECECTIYN